MAVFASKSASYVFNHVFDFNLKGKTVLVKPNFINEMPSSSGVTTSVNLVKRLVLFLKSRGAKVIVAESGLENTSMIFRKLGVNKLPCKVLNLDACARVKVKSRTNLCFSEFNLPRVVLDADFIVSFAKLKTHALTTVTLSVKNLFGFLGKAERQLAHVRGLNESIVDLFSCFNDRVIGLVDGVIALDGKIGPVNGTPRKLGLVIGSLDPVSCDSLCCALIGAKKVTHLMLSSSNKLGSLNYALSGISLVDYKASFSLPPSYFAFLSKLLSRYRKKKPFLCNPSNCVKCYSCVNNCPVNAISKDLSFDYRKCIGCMICIESCKHSALGYKLSFPASVIHPVLKKLR
ncbi:MAG TPA: DUF362 domain-containing protein [Candidatus Nanoarchaeia archaeon]|nr:DUF362 domain-containing protein [Candidatus Nanoarchaeia archaeon]